jgi:hypothetical protein
MLALLPALTLEVAAAPLVGSAAFCAFAQPLAKVIAPSAVALKNARLVKMDCFMKPLIYGKSTADLDRTLEAANRTEFG